MSDVHDAPKPFKWVKSDDPSLDTSSKFRMAQDDPGHMDKAESLLKRRVDTVSEAVSLNQDVVALYHDLANPITSRKCGKAPNKKKWFDQTCRTAKKEANRADRNAERNPHSLFLRDQHFLKKKSTVQSEDQKKGNSCSR